MSDENDEMKTPRPPKSLPEYLQKWETWSVDKVCNKFKASKSTLIRWNTKHDFPMLLPLGPNRVAYLRREIEAWMMKQLPEQGQEEYRAILARRPCIDPADYYLQIISKAEMTMLVPYTSHNLARMERKGQFCKRLENLRNKVGWRLVDYVAWIDERIAIRDGRVAAKQPLQTPPLLPTTLPKKPDDSGNTGGATVAPA